MCEECPAQIDVEELAEVKLLMARHQDSLQKETTNGFAKASATREFLAEGIKPKASNQH